MEQKQKRQTIIKGILLLLFVGLIAFITIRYAGTITHLVKNPTKFRLWLDEYGALSVVIFILFQMLQVIVAAIPGEFIQIAGGYIYGTFWGTIYSSVGIVLGALVAFAVARFLGYSLLKNIVPSDQLKKFDFLINSPKAEITMFMLFLIPGIPKDTLTYIAGITPIKPNQFFLLFTIARFPSMWGASFIGSNLQEQDYLPVIIVSVIATVLFVIGLLKKDWLIEKLHRFFPSKIRPEEENGQ